MLACRRVRPRSPQQRLVKTPRSHHHDRYVGRFGCCNGRREARSVGRPEFATLGRVDFHRSVGEEFGESGERRDPVVGGVEEDIVAEL